MHHKIIISFVALLTIFWMGVIYSLSATPSEESNNKSTKIVREVVEPVYENTNIKNKYTLNDLIKNANKVFRKFAHASVYLVLSILLNILIYLIIKHRLYFYNLLSIIICFLYACSDEIHQLFVTGRTGQFIDVLIDTLGALIGCLIFNIIYKIIKNTQKK